MARGKTGDGPLNEKEKAEFDQAKYALTEHRRRVSTQAITCLDVDLLIGNCFLRSADWVNRCTDVPKLRRFEMYMRCGPAHRRVRRSSPV
jgi:hypothetical protein